MTQNEPQSCDRFNCFKIMIIKNAISRWSDKSKETVSNNIGTALVPHI